MQANLVQKEDEQIIIKNTHVAIILKEIFEAKTN